MPSFADQPWAKLASASDGHVQAALPLVDHCLDVAAVFEALMRAGAWDGYPNLLQLEATLRLLEANPPVTIPADNRRLVENALHPDLLAALAEELGTRWLNHAADCAGTTYADRTTAENLSLDLSIPFRDLVFPDNAEAVLTRLGARDLLVDLDPPLDGPFGQPVERIAIPAWMAGGAGPDDRPTPAVREANGWRFDLGRQTLVYGRWGLASAG